MLYEIHMNHFDEDYCFLLETNLRTEEVEKLLDEFQVENGLDGDTIEEFIDFLNKKEADANAERAFLEIIYA